MMMGKIYWVGLMMGYLVIIEKSETILATVLTVICSIVLSGLGFLANERRKGK